MSGTYKLHFDDGMEKKMARAYQRGKGVRVILYKNSPGGISQECSLSRAQIRRYNKLADGKQKLHFSHKDMERNHTGGVSLFS